MGSFGKDSDSNHFLNPSHWTLLANESLNIPEPSQLPNTNESVLYIFVGDEAFGLSKNVLQPYGERYLSEKKNI